MFNKDLDLYPDVSSRAGLAPGALVFRGEKRQEHTNLTVMRYNTAGFIDEHANIDINEALRLINDNPDGVTWVNLSGMQQVQWIRLLGDQFNAHPLVIEDILNTTQRPKLDDFNDHLLFELNMLTWNEDSCETTTEQLSLLMKPGLVVTFQEVDGDIFDNLRMHIRDGRNHLHHAGADYLAYSILDVVVDHYFIVLESLSDEIELLEDEISGHPDPSMLKRIHQFKRQLLFLRKSTWPLRESISSLARGTSPLIASNTLIYLRDVYEHSIQIMDIIETFRDMVSGILDIYLSSVSNQMSEVMKVLTVISTLFIPLTFIVGLYGMNFQYMPELYWRWGYYAVLGFMFLLALLMVYYFRRKNWF